MQDVKSVPTKKKRITARLASVTRTYVVPVKMCYVRYDDCLHFNITCYISQKRWKL